MTPMRLLLTLLAALMAASAIAEPGPAPADVPEKFLDLTIDPVERSIRGELRMHRPPGASEFRLWDGLRVHQVRVGEETLQVARTPGDRYRIQVPDVAPPVVITWSGILPAPGEGVAGMFMDRDGGFLSPEGGWYPVFETGQPYALRLHARVPSGQRLVATGSLVEEATDDGTRYTVRHAHPHIDAVVLVTGPWLERSAAVDGVHVRTLFPEALDTGYAQSYLEHTTRYLRMFAARAGAYPYESFTIAASPSPVGVAFPGFTVLGERVIPLPFIPHTSLAHELLHSWWGTGVRVDYASGNWSEALTTYMADYHLAEQRGEARQTRHRWLLDLAALPPELDRALATFRGGNQRVDRIVGYNRGAMMFHMLNRRIGAQAFDAGTRLFSGRHMFRVASWDDLQAAFSEAAGEDLSGFFEAWLHRPGLPELALHDVEHSRDGDGWEIRGVLEQVQDADPWPLAVPLVVETGNGPVRHTVSMGERRAPSPCVSPIRLPRSRRTRITTCCANWRMRHPSCAWRPCTPIPVSRPRNPGWKASGRPCWGAGRSPRRPSRRMRPCCWWAKRRRWPTGWRHRGCPSPPNPWHGEDTRAPGPCRARASWCSAPTTWRVCAIWWVRCAITGTGATWCRMPTAAAWRWACGNPPRTPCGSFFRNDCAPGDRSVQS
jgi:hypothetical protein